MGRRPLDRSAALHDLTGYSEQPGGHRREEQANRLKGKPPARSSYYFFTILATLKPIDGTSASDAVLEIETPAGKAAIRLQDVNFGTPRKYLGGKIVVQRVSTAIRIVSSPSDNDYPAAVRGRDGCVWVAYAAYQRGGEPDMAAAARNDFRTFVPTGNGDQIRLVKFDGKRWSAPMPVTEPLLDLWKPSVTVNGAGKVWVAWSQNSDGNWNLYRRSYDPTTGQWSAAEQITPAGREHQRRFRHRLQRHRMVGLARPPREAFSDLPDRRRCRRDACATAADHRDRESGQPLGSGDRRRQQGRCLPGLGRL